MKKILMSLVFLLAASSFLMAQEKFALKADAHPGKNAKDTLLTGKKLNEEGNRHILLNASTFQAPRNISIGLPVTDPGDFVIIENDLPVVYANMPQGPQSIWRPGDGAFASINMLSTRDALMQYGRVGYVTNSYLQNGLMPSFDPVLGFIPPKDFQGMVNYHANAYGMQQFDMTMSGAMKKGWYYSMNTWQSFDPGYFKIPYHSLNNRLEEYRASLTKVFNNNKGDITVNYRYANTYDLFPVTGNSPFIYYGPGNIGHINDVTWGTDYYGMSNGDFTYRDVKTGAYHTESVQDASKNHSNNVQALMHYNFDNGMRLKVSARWQHADAGVPLQIATQITDLTKTPKPYMYLDGTNFTGRYAQQWLSIFQNGKIDDKMFKAELSKTTDKHSWKLGLEEIYHWAQTIGSSSFYDQTVEKDPKYLISPANGPAAIDGTSPINNPYYLLNVAGDYYKGHENKSSLYFSDDWQILDRFKVGYGVRFDLLNVHGENMPYDSYPGIYIGAPVSPMPGAPVTKLATFTHNYTLPSANVNFTYNFSKKTGVLGEYTFATQGFGLPTFGGFGSQQPTGDQIKMTKVSFGRVGLFLNSPFVDLVTAFTYLHKPGNVMALSSKYTPQEGDPEFGNPLYDNSNVSVLMKYDIQTLGWTTDMLFHPMIKGLDFHVLVQYMNPQYKKYDITPIYQAASVPMGAPNPWLTANHTFNYDNKVVSNMPKWTLELDPSYTIQPIGLRIWGSFRYYTKTFGNITNTISYASHWETFGGIDWNATKTFTLFFNVENIFNQLGMSGSISSTEFLNSQQLNQMISGGYPVTGNYLRPQSFIFGAKIRF